MYDSQNTSSEKALYSVEKSAPPLTLRIVGH